MCHISLCAKQKKNTFSLPFHLARLPFATTPSSSFFSSPQFPRKTLFSNETVAKSNQLYRGVSPSRSHSLVLAHERSSVFRMQQKEQQKQKLRAHTHTQSLFLFSTFIRTFLQRFFSNKRQLSGIKSSSLRSLNSRCFSTHIKNQDKLLVL